MGMDGVFPHKPSAIVENIPELKGAVVSGIAGVDALPPVPVGLQREGVQGKFIPCAVDEKVTEARMTEVAG